MFSFLAMSYSKLHNSFYKKSPEHFLKSMYCFSKLLLTANCKCFICSMCFPTFGICHPLTFSQLVSIKQCLIVVKFTFSLMLNDVAYYIFEYFSFWLFCINFGLFFYLMIFFPFYWIVRIPYIFQLEVLYQLCVAHIFSSSLHIFFCFSVESVEEYKFLFYNIQFILFFIFFCGEYK